MLILGGRCCIFGVRAHDSAHDFAHPRARVSAHGKYRGLLQINTKVQQNEQQIHTKLVRCVWCHGLVSTCFPPRHQKRTTLWCHLWCTGEKGAPRFCCTRLLCSLVSFGVKMQDFWCATALPDVSPKLHGAATCNLVTFRGDVCRGVFPGTGATQACSPDRGLPNVP